MLTAKTSIPEVACFICIFFYNHYRLQLFAPAELAPLIHPQGHLLVSAFRDVRQAQLHSSLPHSFHKLNIHCETRGNTTLRLPGSILTATLGSIPIKLAAKFPAEYASPYKDPPSGCGSSRSFKILISFALESPFKSFPFYHTTFDIHAYISTLPDKCKTKTVLESFLLPEGQYIDIITFSRGEKFNNTTRGFFLFGEHARELISSESAFSFIQALCNDDIRNFELPEDCSPFPESFVIKIIPNANPVSRVAVEQGNFCLRTNENGVDLNRNWSSNWNNNSLNGSETFPGKEPFSEAETQFIRDKLEKFQAHTFVTIHSGTCAYMTPLAAASSRPIFENQREKWESILKVLQSYGPHCPTGAAEDVVGYKCPGTCLDYAYEALNVPYPFGFEIYKSPTLKQNLRLVASHNQISRYPLKNLNVSKKNKSLSSSHRYDMMCFATYNPITKLDYRNVLDLWNKNYGCLLGNVAKAIHR